MQKIRNGKLYDTKTAKLVSEYEWGIPGNIDHVYEALYVKTTGEFFLFARGGANTEYRSSYSAHSWGEGKTIIPLSEDEAKAWAEEHCDGETYITTFGPVTE